MSWRKKKNASFLEHFLLGTIFLMNEVKHYIDWKQDFERGVIPVLSHLGVKNERLWGGVIVMLVSVLLSHVLVFAISTPHQLPMFSLVFCPRFSEQSSPGEADTELKGREERMEEAAWQWQFVGQAFAKRWEAKVKERKTNGEILAEIKGD